jgi:chemotaxis-related protein WspD
MTAPSAMAASPIDDCWNRIGVRGNGSCPELERHVHCRNCPVHTTAAGALLDAPLPHDYQRFWAQHFAQPSHLVRSDTQAVLVFRIGAEWLALPASRCRQIVEMRPIRTLPHRRDETVLGIASIDGTLLPCVSLAAILNASDLNADPARSVAAARLIVLSTSAGAVVIRADEVHRIERTSANSLTPPPATVTQASATYTKGLFRCDDKSVGLLDDALLEHTLNRSLV